MGHHHSKHGSKLDSCDPSCPEKSEQQTFLRPVSGEGHEKHSSFQHISGVIHHLRRKHPEHTEAIHNLHTATRLNEIEMEKVRHCFEREAVDRNINLEQFKDIMGELQEEFNLSELNTAYLERLFSIFDLDGNGVVDCDEILSGIALLCKGTVEEKLELCFQMIDQDKSGYIDRGELYKLLKQAYLQALDVAMKAHPDSLSQEHIADAKKHAAARVRVLVDAAWETMDLDHDSKVTFDEFKKWAITQPEIYANIASEIGAGYSDAHAPVLPFPVTPEPERRSDSNSDEVSSEQSGNSKSLIA